MLVKTFVCEEHEEHGTLGFREKSKPHFDPYGGMAVAHDCLEHFPDDKESIEYEAQALGAMLHIRRSSRMSHHEQWEDIQSDCIDLFHLYRYDGRAFNSPTTQMEKPLRDRYAQEQIQKLVASLPNFLKIENDYENEYEDVKERAEQLIMIFSANMGGWMRHGFRRCKRRWRGDGYYVGQVFTGIRDEVDRVLKYAEAGDEIKVIVNMKRYDFKVIHSTVYDLHPEYQEA